MVIPQSIKNIFSKKDKVQENLFVNMLGRENENFIDGLHSKKLSFKTKVEIVIMMIILLVIISAILQ